MMPYDLSEVDWRSIAAFLARDDCATCKSFGASGA